MPDQQPAARALVAFLVTHLQIWETLLLAAVRANVVDDRRPGASVHINLPLVQLYNLSEVGMPTHKQRVVAVLRPGGDPCHPTQQCALELTDLAPQLPRCLALDLRQRHLRRLAVACQPPYE